MTTIDGLRAHIHRYALTPRHRVVALALLESAPYEDRDGRSWLGLANNVIKALDEYDQRTGGTS